ncbi:unnamed protein product [Closterium sp. NIES-54]
MEGKARSLLKERRAPELDFDKRYAQCCSSFGINPPPDILSALASPSHRISEDGSSQLAVELPLAHLSDAVAVTLGEFLATACPELHIVDVSSADAVPTVSGHGILFLLRAVGPHLQHANLSNIPLGREAFRDLFQRGLNARSLCFSFCRVRKLDFVGAFPRLRSVVLDHNPAITCLPDGCFSNAPSLTSLSLCATGISNLWTTIAALGKLPLLTQLRFQRCMCCRGDTSSCAELAAGLAGDAADADEGARREVARANAGTGGDDDADAGVGQGDEDVVEIRAWLGEAEGNLENLVREGMEMDEVMREWEAQGQAEGNRDDALDLAFAAEQVGMGFGGPGDEELGVVGDEDLRNAQGEEEEEEMFDGDASDERPEEEEDSDEDEEERERREGEFRHAGMPWQQVLSREPRGLRQGSGEVEDAAEATMAGNNGGATGVDTERLVPRAVPLGPSPRMRPGRLHQRQPLFWPIPAVRTAAAVPGTVDAQGTGVLAEHRVVRTAAARGAGEQTAGEAAAAARADPAGLGGAGGMPGGLTARELDLISYLMGDAPRRLRGRETGANATNDQRADAARAARAVRAGAAGDGGAARRDYHALEGPYAAASNFLHHSSPICHVPHYRAFVLSSLPHLDVLDNMAVREGERAQAEGECESSFEPLPYGLGSIGNVVHLLRRREIRAPLRALASVAARPLPSQQSVSKENLPPVGAVTGTAVAGGAAVAASAAATPVIASYTTSSDCVTGSSGGPAGDAATEELVGGQQRQQDRVAGVLGSGSGDGADSQRVGQTDMEYLSHDSDGDENGDGDDGDEDDSGSGRGNARCCGKGKAPVEEQDPEPASARLWHATAGAKGGSVEGYRRALGANRVGCSSWPASRPMTCPLRNAGLDAPRTMSSSLRPRQFEYHPTEAHLMVFGTLHGDVVVLNHESDRLVGHVQSVGAPHSILGLCWLNKHPNRLIGGCDNGSIQLYDVERMRACLVAAIGRSAAAAASTSGASSSGTGSSTGSSMGGGSVGTLTGSGGRGAATAAAAAAVAPADLTTPPAVLAAPAAGVGRTGGLVSDSPLGLGGSASGGSPVTPGRLRHPAIHTYDEFEQLTSVHVNCTDDLFLASGYSNHVGLYDLHTGRRLHTLHNLHREHINVLKFAHHSPHVFATSSFDRHVKLWDARQRISSSSGGGFGGLFAQGRESVRPIYSVRSDRGNVMVCFSPDDQFLLSSAVDNEVRQHIAVDGRLQQRFEIAALGSAHNYTRSYYMNGRDYIVSGSCEENVVRICCAKTGRRLRDIPLEGKGGKSSLYVQSLRGDPFRDFHLSVLVAYSQPNSPSDIVKVNLVAGPPHRKGLDNDFQTQPLASVGA